MICITFGRIDFYSIAGGENDQFRIWMSLLPVRIGRMQLLFVRKRELLANIETRVMMIAA